MLVVKVKVTAHRLASCVVHLSHYQKYQRHTHTHVYSVYTKSIKNFNLCTVLWLITNNVIVEYAPTRQTHWNSWMHAPSKNEMKLNEIDSNEST